MTTSKQYDYLNRLSSISSSPSSAFNYQYNAANQRTLDRLGDGSYWRYGYDALGQVTSGMKYWSDQTPVAGQQFGYAFDTIGNRTQTQAGGDQNGANLRAAGYTNNLLNQITSRGVPGDVDVMGDALATSGVTVNTLTAYRKEEYFREQLSVGNTSTAIWQSVTTASPGQTSVTGNAYVPKTPELYAYDADGNLLTDGRWTYAWDGENRLLSMTSLTGAPAGSQLQLNFAYDYQGRRIQKSVWTWNGTSWIISGSATNYAYDGWNCIAALNSTPSLLESFLWGSDLSGSLQGAGGVGGLLEVSYYGTPAMNCFVAFDGNGNVSALVNAANRATVANYDYGPFGEVIRATGPMAKVNPFRFSTKYQDDETDFLYYGYRYYNPSTGRWLSRDPIGELGFGRALRMPHVSRSAGPNLYSFTKNDAVDGYDIYGLLAGGSCTIGTVSEALAEGATAEEVAEVTAIAIAATPVEAVVLSVAVTAGAVVVTYKVCNAVCDSLYCANRHPTWPGCYGPSDPGSAITGGNLYPGWNVDGTPTITASGPATPAICPSGGTWYTLTTKFFTVIQTGTITYTMNLSVACCNCCNKFTSGQTCRVIHPGRGSGGQPPPPSGPPFQGQK